jgi:hypothetical protein
MSSTTIVKLLLDVAKQQANPTVRLEIERQVAQLHSRTVLTQLIEQIEKSSVEDLNDEQSANSQCLASILNLLNSLVADDLELYVTKYYCEM